MKNNYSMYDIYNYDRTTYDVYHFNSTTYDIYEYTIVQCIMLSIIQNKTKRIHYVTHKPFILYVPFITFSVFTYQAYNLILFLALIFGHIVCFTCLQPKITCCNY